MLPAVDVLIENVIRPLLDEVQKLRDEVKVLKELNCDIIRHLKGMKSYSNVLQSYQM